MLVYRVASPAVESTMRLSPGILIAEVRIRRKAITAYEQDARDRGRRCPDAEIRDRVENVGVRVTP